MTDKKPKFSLGEKANYIFDDGSPCEVTVIEIVPTEVGFYYEVVGWEKTSWGHVNEDRLRKVTK